VETNFSDFFYVFTPHVFLIVQIIHLVILLKLLDFSLAIIKLQYVPRIYLRENTIDLVTKKLLLTGLSSCCETESKVLTQTSLYGLVKTE
jgi:hypothetical protein